MDRFGNCAPCAAAASPVPFMLGRYPQPRRSGLGDWYSELKSHLRPMAPWIIAAAAISGYAGFKLGKWYCSGLFLQREALVATGVGKKRKRRRKKR